MTSCDRATTRLTAAVYRGRPIVLRIDEGGSYVSCRLKGTRTWHRLPVLSVWFEAAKLTARELKEAKQKARELRRKARS